MCTDLSLFCYQLRVKTEKRVLELGGATTLERRRDGVNGWYTTFKDPEGNQFGGFEADMEILTRGIKQVGPSMMDTE
jgi:predicted enzyme related to lactoylglutathione lyase